MKKRCFTAAAAVLLGLLAGCGSAGGSASQPQTSAEAGTRDIGSSQAADIAFSDAGTEESGVSHLLVSREEENGTLYYQIEFTVPDDGQREYRYEIQAENGTILSKEVTADSAGASVPESTPEPSGAPAATASPTPTAAPAPSTPAVQETDDGILSFEEAKQLALERVPGASDRNIELELDHDDGFILYEGEIHYQNMEYEFEIDASTGNFIKWSADYHD